MAEEHTLSPVIEVIGQDHSRGSVFILRDFSGQEMERIGYAPDGTLIYRQLSFWTTLPNGDRFFRGWSMNPDGTVLERSEGCKDGQGRMKSQIYFTAAETILDKQEWVYDDVNHLLTFTRWDHTGQIIEKWESPTE